MAMSCTLGLCRRKPSIVANPSAGGDAGDAPDASVPASLADSGSSFLSLQIQSDDDGSIVLWTCVAANDD
jgi:hypothetical protein